MGEDSLAVQGPACPNLEVRDAEDPRAGGESYKRCGENSIHLSSQLSAGRGRWIFVSSSLAHSKRVALWRYGHVWSEKGIESGTGVKSTGVLHKFWEPNARPIAGENQSPQIVL